MSETTQSTNVQEREVPASNWDALNSSKQFGDIELVEKQEQAAEVKKEDEVKNQVENKTEEVEKPEVKKEEIKAEEKKEEIAAKTEEKKEEKEIKPDAKVEEKPLEFTAEDIGLKEAPAEDSWLKLGQDLNLELKEDSDVALKEALTERLKQAEEKGRALTKDALFAEMKPEVALALKRIEAGMKPEIAVNPTSHIDQTLKLSDAEIIRADLELREGWDADRIDTHMEILNENPKRLAHEAGLVRDELKTVKAQVEAEANQYLQTYEQNKQTVANQRVQEQKSLILNELKSTKEFMGGKLLDTANEAIIQKFNQGGFDNILNDPKAIAKFIISETLGEKAFKAKLEAEYQRGKLEKAKDLANVPPVNSKTGNQKEEKINQINNWSALENSVFADEKK